ncbi:ubiquinol-cytochrome-c reductase complex assembly factor 3 [Antennarius striatus]|uniref:ubiquinol-cytochrome-c reductase complex assembly factor 3 n=1 Tax=Antennarius striatus TaxID=241820 RepID=UPI0035B36C53
MSGLRTMTNLSGMLIVVMGGYGMWTLMSPDEDRRRKLIKHLPESSPMMMEESRKRNALMMQVMKEASETHLNLARGNIRPPGRQIGPGSED